MGLAPFLLENKSVVLYWILNNWLDDCVRNMFFFILQSVNFYT